MKFYLTLKSKNKKTGPIPVSTSSADTCPPACPLQGSGCYAEHGPLSMHWRNVAGDLGGTWQGLLSAVRALPAGQLWRHNQAGDLPGEGNYIDPYMLAELVEANKGKRGWTYTHKPVDGANVGNNCSVQSANYHGFTVNLSANNLEHADRLADLEIGPVVTVLSREVHGRTNLHTPAGRRVVVCPATHMADVSCATCALCQVRDRKVIVGFPAHGNAARKASLLATPTPRS
jgi:hypothetical protein